MTSPVPTTAGSRLVATACVAILLLVSGTWRVEGTDDPANQVTVGPNVAVSGLDADAPHHEVMIDADPEDPGRLVACAMVDHVGSEPSVRAYTSHDGGRSWKLSTTISAGDALVADPSCVWGTGGSVLLTALQDTRSPRAPRVREMTVKFADREGKTWQDSTIQFPWKPAESVRVGIDRQYLVADHVSSRFRSRVYLYAQARNLTLEGQPQQYAFSLWRSLDGGRSFVGPVQRLLSARESYLFLGNGVVLPSGAFGTVVLESASRGSAESDVAGGTEGSLKFITSSDGGETLNAASLIATGPMALMGERHAMPGSAAIQQGALAGRICVVWAERQPGRNSRIILSYSDDEGATWSRPRTVSDERRVGGDAWMADAFMPAIAINKAGVVAVSWYDRRDGVPGRLDYGVRMAVSTDGGLSFEKSIKLSTATRTVGAGERWLPVADVFSRRTWQSPNPFEVSFRVIRDVWLSAGHTAGLTAAADGAFHPLWVDNRTGVDHAWSARVAVPGRADERGAGIPAHMVDVTGRCVLNVGNLRFDARARRLTADVTMVNVSEEAIALPLTIRVTAFESELGEPVLENATNGQPGVGALYTLAAARAADRLDPGASSAALPVRVRFDRLDERAPGRAPVAPPEWLTLSAKAYASGVSPRPSSSTSPSH